MVGIVIPNTMHIGPRGCFGTGAGAPRGLLCGEYVRTAEQCVGEPGAPS